MLQNDVQVGKTCYRAILRWCKWVGNTPFQITQQELQRFVCLQHPEFLQIATNTDVHLLARWAFKRGKHMYGNQAEKALNNAFRSVKFLYKELGYDIKKLKQSQLLHLQRNDIMFHVGQVLRHKKYGYKGVVAGWDRKCQKLEWAEKQNVSPEQPFYQIIPDEFDCVRIFSRAQHIKYVAEENMVCLLFPVYVQHRCLQVYFPHYSSLLGRYIPNYRLQYEYPDNYVTRNADYDALTQQWNYVASDLLMNRDFPEQEDVFVDDWYLKRVEECIQEDGQLVWQ